MKIRQNLRHWAAKNALTAPVLGDIANDKLVDMHTDIFLGKADESAREARRDHLDGFFDATMDTYVAALEAGFSEAKAREITHIQANFDFFNPRLDGDDGDPRRRSLRIISAATRSFSNATGSPSTTHSASSGRAMGSLTRRKHPTNAISRPTRTLSPALPTTCTSRTATANSMLAPEPTSPRMSIRPTPPG